MTLEKTLILGSSPSINTCPNLTIPEYAFLGRSNVGKSSLINMLCGVHGLAKASSTPGKTKLINLFSIDRSWVLADLPGYGYLQARGLKKTISVMLENYLKFRDNLRVVFCLVDIRHAPQSLDINAFEFLLSLGISFTIVFTKIDKLSTSQIRLKRDSYLQFFTKTFQEVQPPLHFLTSSTKGKGRNDILNYITEINKENYLK